jgi:hypothetical protein
MIVDSVPGRVRPSSLMFRRANEKKKPADLNPRAFEL